MRNGFILLHRKGITEDEWKYPLRTLAWIDLLTLAAWDDYTTPSGVLVKRGEVIASETFLAERWRQNRGTVHRWLAYWEAQQMVQRSVQQQGKHSPQRIFLLNYAKYQVVPQQSPQQTEQHSGQQSPQTMKRKEQDSNSQNQNKEAEARKAEADVPETAPAVTEPVRDELRGREERFKRAVADLQKWDEDYTANVWAAGMALPRDRRDKFGRKVNVLLGWARVEGKAGKMGLILNEIAALVNDEGVMVKHLSPQEQAARGHFVQQSGPSHPAAETGDESAEA